MTGNHVRAEGSGLLLKNDRYDVIADVPLALQLLRIAGTVGQHRRHVEQNLSTSEQLVHRGVARLAVPRVQPTSKPTITFQITIQKLRTNFFHVIMDYLKRPNRSDPVLSQFVCRDVAVFFFLFFEELGFIKLIKK